MKNDNDNNSQRSFYDEHKGAFKVFIYIVSILGAITWANVTLTTFTSGTQISSSAVNANFQNLASATLSDIVVSNNAGYIMNETPGSNSWAPVILDVSEGRYVSAYNTSTGEFNLPDSGAYTLEVELGPSAASAYVSFGICEDTVNSAIGGCLGTSYPQFAMNSVWLSGFNNSSIGGGLLNSAGRVYLQSSKTYRMIHYAASSAATSVPTAGDFKIYIKKVR